MDIAEASRISRIATLALVKVEDRRANRRQAATYGIALVVGSLAGWGLAESLVFLKSAHAMPQTP